MSTMDSPYAALPMADRAPLVLGVTGHRDPRPEAVQDLEHAIDDLFERLFEAYPNTPLLLLSALAEGADQLAARRALHHAESGRDIAFIAVLPMCLDLYREDFEGEALAEFDRLLARSTVSKIELPLLSEEQEVRQRGTSRDAQYSFVGAFIARYCQILIALWDGQKSTEAGGTAKVVELAQCGRFSGPEADELHRLLGEAAVELGFQRRSFEIKPAVVLHHIPTPRLKTGSGALPETGSSQFEPRREFQLIEDLNHDIRTRAPRSAEVCAQSANDLLPDTDADQLDGHTNELRHAYATADVLALHFKRCTGRCLDLLLSVVFLAAAIFASYSTLLKDPSGGVILLAIYLLTLALADIYFLHIQRRKFQDKYQDYRAIAEGLRVQIFAWVAGFRLSVADRYLRWQRGELEWIRSVIKRRELTAGPELGPDEKRVDLVREHWIEGQLNFFWDKTREKHGAVIRHRATSASLLLGSLGLAGIEVLRSSVFWRRPEGILVENLAALILFSVAAAIALVHLGLHFQEWDRVLKMVKSEETRDLRLSFGKGILLGGGILSLILAGLVGMRAWLPRETWNENLTSWMIMGMVLSALVGGLLRARASILAESDEARQYERMKLIFEDAALQMKALEPYKIDDEVWQQRWRALIEDLAREALAENGEWVLMHRDRPIEMPRA